MKMGVPQCVKPHTCPTISGFPNEGFDTERAGRISFLEGRVIS